MSPHFYIRSFFVGALVSFVVWYFFGGQQAEAEGASNAHYSLALRMELDVFFVLTAICYPFSRYLQRRIWKPSFDGNFAMGSEAISLAGNLIAIQVRLLFLSIFWVFAILLAPIGIYVLVNEKD